MDKKGQTKTRSSVPLCPKGEKMKLIVGLGNPENEYANTRHNMGFNVINKIAEEYNIDVTKTKFRGICGSGNINGEKIVLLKPQTYMNLSGESINQYMAFYKIEPEDLIIIYDDIDTQPGKIRVRKQGSAGTHNGMKSVVSCIGSENFTRVRVGIGMPEYKGDLMNYVIGNIREEDKENLNKGIELAQKAVIEIIKSGVDSAMNKFN